MYIYLARMCKYVYIYLQATLCCKYVVYLQASHSAILLDDWGPKGPLFTNPSWGFYPATTQAKQYRIPLLWDPWSPV